MEKKANELNLVKAKVDLHRRAAAKEYWYEERKLLSANVIEECFPGEQQWSIKTAPGVYKVFIS